MLGIYAQISWQPCGIKDLKSVKVCMNEPSEVDNNTNSYWPSMVCEKENGLIQYAARASSGAENWTSLFGCQMEAN